MIHNGVNATDEGGWQGLRDRFLTDQDKTACLERNYNLVIY